MRTRYLAAIGLAFVLSAAPASAQLDGAVQANVAMQHGWERRAVIQEWRNYRELGSAQLLQRIGNYRDETEAYRQNALEVAALARTHILPSGSGANIRGALEADMKLWYNSLPVNSRDWTAMHKQWLVPVESLTDQQWAQQRAKWYAARDAWLTARAQDAQLALH